MLLRVVLLRSHLLVRYHGLHGALRLPRRVKDTLVAGNNSCVCDWHVLLGLVADLASHLNGRLL